MGISHLLTAERMPEVHIDDVVEVEEDVDLLGCTEIQLVKAEQHRDFLIMYKHAAIHQAWWIAQSRSVIARFGLFSQVRSQTL